MTLMQFNAKPDLLDSASDHIQLPGADLFAVTLAGAASRCYTLPKSKQKLVHYVFSSLRRFLPTKFKEPSLRCC